MTQHIYVVAEHENGKLRRVTMELIGKARKLADESSQQVCAVLLGDNVDELSAPLIAAGADTVYVAAHPLLAHYTTEGYTKVIADLFGEVEPAAVLIGATNNGRDLAPRLSARLGSGVTADCTQLAMDKETGLMTWTRPALGGHILAEIICPDHMPQMGTVRPNVFPLPTPDMTRTGTIERVAVSLEKDDIRTTRVGFEAVEGEEIGLEDAEIIVSGGRGMGSKEEFARLHELARLLGGTVAASRAAVEAGWEPMVHQVGQTGKNVGPKIYLAFGISGAIQHVAGIGGSDTVVAVNHDAEAPIFKIADYGIVGDVHEVLEALIASIKAARGESGAN